MNNISKHAIIALAFGLTVSALAACSDDDNYSPGSPVESGAQGAYFTSSNAAEYILEPEDSSFQIVVGRRDSTLAASVALNTVYSDTAAIILPDSAHFDAGQKYDTITVDARGLTPKTKYSFRFAVDKKDADHYSKQDGSTTLDAYVIVSQWKKIHENAEFYYYGLTSKLPTTYSDIYTLEGVNKFYISNFMGSGNDFYFTLTPDGAKFNANNIESLCGEMVPVEGMGAYAFDYTTYKLNYVVSGVDENGYYIYNWNVGDVAIDYLDWYGGYNYGPYSWIDFSQKYIYLYGYISSSAYTGFVQIYGVWKD